MLDKMDKSLNRSRLQSAREYLYTVFRLLTCAGDYYILETSTERDKGR